MNCQIRRRRRVSHVSVTLLHVWLRNRWREDLLVPTPLSVQVSVDVILSYNWHTTSSTSGSSTWLHLPFGTEVGYDDNGKGFWGAVTHTVFVSVASKGR